MIDSFNYIMCISTTTLTKESLCHYQIQLKIIVVHVTQHSSMEYSAMNTVAQILREMNTKNVDFVDVILSQSPNTSNIVRMNASSTKLITRIDLMVKHLNLEKFSSNIAYVRYCSECLKFAVKFKNSQDVYVYSDVNHHLFYNFQMARSFGKFYAQWIKGKYSCESKTVYDPICFCKNDVISNDNGTPTTDSFCRNCGSNFNVGDNFCGHCGKKKNLTFLFSYWYV
jgi:hypothetical protein